MFNKSSFSRATIVEGIRLCLPLLSRKFVIILGNCVKNVKSICLVESLEVSGYNKLKLADIRRMGVSMGYKKLK